MKARILQTTKLLAAAAVLTAHAAPALADPLPDDKAPRALIALRSELHGTAEAKALAQMPHFRPLCDAQGYPLVGNVNGKSNGYEPSSFCAAVRKARAGS